MPDLAPMRLMASHASTQPKADPNALTDEELLAVFEDDSADLSLLTPDEQQRLVALTEEPPEETGVSIFGHKLPLPEAISRPLAAWGNAGPSRVKDGLSDVAEGEFSRGAHNVLMGGLTTAAPMLAPRVAGALIKAPVATLTTAAAGATGGLVGGSVAKGAARALGATDDQATLAGDAGGLLGAGAGAKTAQLAGQIASKIASAVPADARLKFAGDIAGDVFPGTAKAVRRVSRVVGKVRAATATPASEPAPVVAPASSTPVAPPPPQPVSVPPVAAASPSAPTPPIRLLSGETLNLPASARSTGQMSPASIGNDLGLSAKRLGVTLPEEGFVEAAELVTSRGRSPVQAVQEVAAKFPTAAAEPAAAAVTTPATPKAATSPRVTRAEATEYARLLAAGKTDAEAIAAIQTQRKLIAKTGATPPAKAARRVKQRIAAGPSGRWPSGTP